MCFFSGEQSNMLKNTEISTCVYKKDLAGIRPEKRNCYFQHEHRLAMHKLYSQVSLKILVMHIGDNYYN